MAGFLTSNKKCVNVFSPNTGKYGPEKTSYLDTFHAAHLCSQQGIIS